MSVIIMDKNDLTRGVIWKKLLLYFLPIAAGTLFQQLYNAVDAIIVARFVGTQALAAVGGSTSSLTSLVINFFTALSGGAAVIIAQSFGAKNEKKVEDSVQTSIVFCFLVGAALIVIMFFAGPGLLRLLKVPGDTLSDAILYLRIYFSGSIFLLLFDMGSGILRAMGNSRKPFVYLVISCLSNIVLDLIFVVLLKMGVAGVAWATVIAQGISTVCVMTDLLKTRECYRIRVNKLKIHGKILKEMLWIGVPSGVQSAMYGVSNMILQVAVNLLGTATVAAWALSGKIDGVYWATITALGIAIVNFVAQNYGAGRMDRVRECARSCIKIYLAATVCLSALILLCADPLLHLFTTDTTVIALTWKVMTYFVPVYFLWTLIEIVTSVLRGLGDAVAPAVILGITVCLFRVLWVLTVFRNTPTLFTVSVCYPISWTLALIALSVHFRKRVGHTAELGADAAMEKGENYGK